MKKILLLVCVLTLPCAAAQAYVFAWLNELWCDKDISQSRQRRRKQLAMAA